MQNIKFPQLDVRDVTTKEIVDEHFSVAADMVTDTVVKNMFLANWRE